MDKTKENVSTSTPLHFSWWFISAGCLITWWTTAGVPWEPSMARFMEHSPLVDTQKTGVSGQEKKKKITWSAFTFKGRIRSRILTLGLDFKIWILKNISTIILSGYVMTRISILPTWPVQPLITHLCNAEHDQLCDQFSRMTCQLISTLMLHHRIELGFLAAKTISVK